MNTNGRMQKAVARGKDNQRSPEIGKNIKIESERERGGYRGDRQKWSRIMGSYQLPRSIPHPHPISHGNYAYHHERLTKKEKKTTPLDPLNHKTAPFISTGMQMPHCYKCVSKMKRAAFFISRRE